MSKIKKKNLARGTKLSIQQVWDNNLDGVITNINRAEESDGLIQPMYEAGQGTFRLNFNIPWIGADWTRVNGVDKPYIIPFCLLPLQNFITSDGSTSDDTPTVTLIEFSYGIDQRAEPAFITDPTCGPGGGTNQTWSEYVRSVAGAYPAAGVTPNTITELEYKQWFTNQNQGKLDFGQFLGRGDFKFSILKKDMQYFNSNATSLPEDSIWNQEVPIIGFSDRIQRLNPFAIKDLNVSMDPYSTYCLGITPPRLDDIDGGDKVNLALVNLTISLKFKSRLVLRDKTPAAGVGDPPNIPEHGGHKVDDNVTVTKGVPDGPILAETAAGFGGLNTTTATIDEVFRKELNAGYDASSNRPSVEQLAQDSGYEIIAVPLWNNQNQNMFTGRDAIIGAGPYSYGMFNSGIRITSGAGLPGPNELNYVAEAAPISTRAIIPIDYPFVVHHVVLAANVFTAAFNITPTAGAGAQMYQTAHVTSPIPNDGSNASVPGVRTRHDIGIGIGTGLRGTKYGYKQLLNYSGLDLNKDDFKLDNIRMNYPCTTSDVTGGDSTSIAPAPAVAPRVDQPDYEWRTFYLPINGVSAGTAQVSPGLYNQAGTAATPATYTAMQNPPTFAGNSFVLRDDSAGAGAPGIGSYSGTSVRINDPDNTARGDILSADQWIEVRWNTYPWDEAGGALPTYGWKDFARNTAAGLPQSPWTATAANAQYDSAGFAENKIIHGYGGHWIYLIGKKTTVSDANWQDTDLKGGM